MERPGDEVDVELAEDLVRTIIGMRITRFELEGEDGTVVHIDKGFCTSVNAEPNVSLEEPAKELKVTVTFVMSGRPTDAIRIIRRPESEKIDVSSLGGPDGIRTEFVESAGRERWPRWVDKEGRQVDIREWIRKEVRDLGGGEHVEPPQPRMSLVDPTSGFELADALATARDAVLNWLTRMGWSEDPRR